MSLCCYAHRYKNTGLSVSEWTSIRCSGAPLRETSRGEIVSTGLSRHNSCYYSQKQRNVCLFSLKLMGMVFGIWNCHSFSKQMRQIKMYLSLVQSPRNATTRFNASLATVLAGSLFQYGAMMSYHRKGNWVRRPLAISFLRWRETAQLLKRWINFVNWRNLLKRFWTTNGR